MNECAIEKALVFREQRWAFKREQKRDDKFVLNSRRGDVFSDLPNMNSPFL